MSSNIALRTAALSSVAMLIAGTALAQELAEPEAQPAPPPAAEPAPRAAEPEPAEVPAPSSEAADEGADAEEGAPEGADAEEGPGDEGPGDEGPVDEDPEAEQEDESESEASGADEAGAAETAAEADVATAADASVEVEAELPPADVASVEEEPGILAGYDKGFVLRDESGNNSLKLVGLLQMRYQYEGVDVGPDRTAFSVARGRFGATGTVLTDRMGYYFLADFGQGQTHLIYYFADYTVAKDALRVRVGQFKRPFSRQFITSSSKLEFINRPVTTTFGDAIDVGVMLHNGSPTFEYAVGVFNGSGQKGVYSGTANLTTGELEGVRVSNVPSRFHPTAVARVGYNHNGIEGYSDADLEGGELRFAVGAAGLGDFDVDEDDNTAVRGALDTVLKVQGYSFTAGAYIGSVQNGPEFADRELDAFGVFGQTGYVINQSIQPVVRYSAVAREGANNDEHHAAAGLNVYFFGHQLKWQNELNFKIQALDDETIVEPTFGTQLTLSI